MTVPREREVPPLSNGVLVRIRYFAAARAAAGTEAETVTIDPETTVAALADMLGRRNPALAKVLSRCCYLCDGIAVRDPAMLLRSGHIIDVLPPFAGG
jgi:molybdopterin synthase sulfur carrier subunit